MMYIFYVKNFFLIFREKQVQANLTTLVSGTQVKVRYIIHILTFIFIYFFVYLKARRRISH